MNLRRGTMMKPYKLALIGIGLAWLTLMIASLARYNAETGVPSVLVLFLLALAVLSATEVLRLSRVMRRQRAVQGRKDKR